jgi:uncharacterized protein YchJ
MKQIALCLLVSLFVMGCHTTPRERPVPLDVSTVFYDRDTFPEKLQQDTEVPQESILEHGRCNLYLATPGATSTTDFRYCTYALTEKNLLIQVWNPAIAQYKQLMDIEFAQLTSADLAVRRQVRQVKMVDPQRLVSFSAIIDEGAYIDTEATERVFLAVQAQGIPPSGDNRIVTTPPNYDGYYYGPVPVMIPIIIPRYHYHHHHYHRFRHR